MRSVVLEANLSMKSMQDKSVAVKKIAVVMSTYNGAAHLREQIDSIVDQELPVGCSLELHVRDDGSTDETKEILACYAAQDKLTYEVGPNIGVVGSFLCLVKEIPSSIDYLCFADQDDVWHADKVSRALEVIDSSEISGPLLYASEYVFCDAGLNAVSRSQLNKKGISFSKLLYENVVSGNTVVINRPLIELVQRTHVKNVYCHDWWVALLAASAVEILYDRNFYSLDYRRTGSNASATGTGGFGVLKNRIRRFLKGGELSLVSQQLVALRRDYDGIIRDECLKVLDRFIEGSRMSKALYPKRLRQTISGELMVRILFILGKL